MRVSIPPHIKEAFEKCDKYILPGRKIDPNAPEEAKEAFEIYIKWKEKFDDFM